MSIVGAVILASLLPIHGQAAIYYSTLTQLAVALLFFLNGARLSRQAILAGLTHWRLHLVVSAATFALFPLLGIAISSTLTPLLGPGLALGFLYLCCLPSTIQSSVAFTSIANGNVPAAICSATLSNVIGVILTPLLVGTLLSAHGDAVNTDAFLAIIEQLLLPFIAGQFMRRWVGDWIKRHARLTSLVDRGSIVMVVYGAFSDAVSGGLWQSTSGLSLALMIVTAILLLALVLFITSYIGRKMGFSHADRIVILFCGSKKSMASGVPMASILFPAATVGTMVLPVMLFHQIQLMVCAWLAKRYAQQEQSL